MRPADPVDVEAEREAPFGQRLDQLVPGLFGLPVGDDLDPEYQAAVFDMYPSLLRTTASGLSATCTATPSAAAMSWA